ncbi:MAG: 8-oxo-dGTP diphosphatase, partial [Firmicutes bacterium]|nr:8-oxo-dGTP diphosphatase [Bacillota bacterium]
MKKRQTTLVLVKESDKILLPMKKRGLGVGKYNGYGGKREEGETIEEAAIRETFEEGNFTPQNLKKVAINTFELFWKGEWMQQECHIFFADSYVGTPAETEEMSPHWFDVDKIPYDKMWSDDIHWLP